MLDILSLLGSNVALATVVTYLYAKWYVGRSINGIKEDILDIKHRLGSLEEKIRDLDEIKGELKVIHELVMRLLNGKKL